MTKFKKAVQSWTCCQTCMAAMTLRDLSVHGKNCPPQTQNWSHSYILDSVLYSTLDCYIFQGQPQNISEPEMDTLIFMAQTAMQQLGVAISDPVVVTGVSGDQIIRRAWPTEDRTLTSVSMTRRSMENSGIDGQIKITKLSIDPQIAREISVEYTRKELSLPKLTPDLEVMMRNRSDQNVFSVGNRLSVPYYGKSLGFKIVKINDDVESGATDPRTEELVEGFNDIQISEGESKTFHKNFYKAVWSTKWTLPSSVNEEKKFQSKAKMTTHAIGGYKDLIVDLKDVLDVALGKWKRIKGFNVPKGILLHGTPGVGKSIIANAVLSDYSAKIFAINGSEIQRKIAGDAESGLGKIFEEAKNNEAPSVIFIEDIDALCPRRSRSNVDNDRGNGCAELVKILDEIHALAVNIVVLATTSRPDSIDSSLRRPGRIDKELEVCAPTPIMRREILEKILDKIPNTLIENDVDFIASTTHGFVGADLHGLCSDAALRAMKRHHYYRNDASESDLTEIDDDIEIELQDIHEALKTAKPSAMREVIVEVPNVKWTDIGGQASLKLKLKQAVEWPLRHPEAFTRLGISPPRGLLMFGPPGCSKTMIAKALATESKLNFLNIKGPELFSKWVGESEKAVRQVFRKARQVAPSIIFIDEIDALGSERASSSSGNGGSNVQERVLAQLLTELDGVTALGNVTLVAATNRPDRIDKALLRPGRLDRIVYVPLPDTRTRREIFAIKFQKMPCADDVIIQDLVELTEGYSGAEIQAICHEAAMKALEEDLDANIITKEHFKAAFTIVTPRTPPSLVKMYEDYINNCK